MLKYHYVNKRLIYCTVLGDMLNVSAVDLTVCVEEYSKIA